MTTVDHGRNYRASTAIVDAYASKTARDVLSGHLNEQQGRAQILSCLIGSAAVTAMVELHRRQHSQTSGAMADAIRAQCEQRLRSKVLNTNNTGVKLEQLMASSATGWAERFLKSGATWIFVNAARTVQEYATDPHQMPHSQLWSEGSKPTSEEVHRDVYAWMEANQSSRNYMLDQARSATALQVTYGLPDVVRPHYLVRPRVLRVLKNNPASACTAARHQLMAVAGTPVDEREQDKDMMALWDNYTPDQLHTLLSADHRAASCLAEVGCADYLRPSKKDIKAFTGRIMRCAGKTTVEQRSLIREAINAFIETEFSIDQLRGAEHKRSRSQRLEDQQRYRSLTPQLFEAVAEQPTGLGATANQVYESFTEHGQPMIHELKLIDHFHEFSTSDDQLQQIV